MSGIRYYGYRRQHLDNDGQPTTWECVVQVEEADGTRRRLAPRLDLLNHSPAGFEWGYGGSGPAQLALALVADCFGDDARAQRQYQWLKTQLVATFPHDGWTLEHGELAALLELPEADPPA